MKFYEDIIRKPVLSEKTYDMIGDKRYVFVVDRRANKVEIKKAVRFLLFRCPKELPMIRGQVVGCMPMCPCRLRCCWGKPPSIRRRAIMSI